MVRHVSKKVDWLLGKWSPIIEEVAKFPGKVIYFFRSNTLKVDPQIAKTDFEKSLNIYNQSYFDNYEDGYLLVSTYDYDNGSFILLYLKEKIKKFSDGFLHLMKYIKWHLNLLMVLIHIDITDHNTLC